MDNINETEDTSAEKLCCSMDKDDEKCCCTVKNNDENPVEEDNNFQNDNKEGSKPVAEQMEKFAEVLTSEFLKNKDSEEMQKLLLKLKEFTSMAGEIFKNKTFEENENKDEHKCTKEESD